MSKQRHKRRQVPVHEEPPDDATMKRVTNNYMLYWLVCGASACKRKRGCAGDTVACFERLWPFTPEAMKVHFRASIMAINKGVTSAAEVGRIARAEVERAAEHIAYVDAVQARASEVRVAAETNTEAPHPARTPGARHPLPASGEKEERRIGPRVRAL
jgi:hypothetical protein